MTAVGRASEHSQSTTPSEPEARSPGVLSRGAARLALPTIYRRMRIGEFELIADAVRDKLTIACGDEHVGIDFETLREFMR